jgi:hypothetical protein
MGLYNSSRDSIPLEQACLMNPVTDLDEHSLCFQEENCYVWCGELVSEHLSDQLIVYEGGITSIG